MKPLNAKNLAVLVLTLFGDDDESAKPLIYIGESEDCLARLKQHNREKTLATRDHNNI